MKKRDAEQRIIDTARLVLLGWLGDTIDGGQAMREAIGELRAAFEALDAKPVQNGWEVQADLRCSARSGRPLSARKPRKAGDDDDQGDSDSEEVDGGVS